MWHPKSVLSVPWIYRALQRGLGTGHSQAEYIRTYVRPVAGARVLDLGCGPADILDWLPETHYVGVDASAQYIEEAKSRYGDRGQFICRSVTEYALEQPASFDVVMANGVLHHLSDEEAITLFRVARGALKSGGRLVTLDACFVPNQSRIARWMLQNDRGRFVRFPDQYLRLASSNFQRVEQHVRHDLLRVPYTHIIMVCEAKSGGTP
jgi:SAM-dependent methyltransferase